MRQEIIKELKDIIEKTDIGDQEVLTQLTQLVERARGSIQTSQPTSLELLYTNMVANWHKGKQENNLLQTQFRNVDELIGGFMPGEFVVIGGRPSMGKTQLLVNLALNFSKALPVLFFSYDLSDYMLTNRIVSTLSGIPIDRILQEQIALKEKQLTEDVLRQLKERRIYVCGGTMNSLALFRQQCIDQIAENHIKVIMVDSLQSIALSKFRGNREQEIGNFTRELKAIANETGAVVIASSQLSRSLETRKESKIPVLSDLRESGSIEQDADKVIMLYRPEYYGINNDEFGDLTEGETHLSIAKNSFGNVGIVKLRMLKGNGFVDMGDDFTGSKLYNSDFAFSPERKNEIR